MNKKILFVASFALTLVFVSCNKNMTALDASYFKTTPNPLEVKGGKVDATVTGTFPVKYFNKKAVVTVTPVLKYNGAEAKAQSSTFQGEKVLANNQTIAYKSGGTFTIKPSFLYTPDMAKSELYLNFDVAQKKKTYQLPAVKVADGVIATAELASTSPKELKPALTSDKFKRITQENQEADILFLIQQAQLRNSELKSSDVKAFTQKAKEVRDAQNKEISTLEVLGYASPEGALDLNTNLAEKRQKVTADYVNKEFKKLKEKITIDSRFTAEDWDGFQKLMETSNIQDKDLILRVLSMYQDPEQREREIRNLSTAFKSIANDILPQLRRSRLRMTVDVTGKSDEQIAQLASGSPESLSAEELLYAATLSKTNDEKAAIYQKFVTLFPNDVRGYNNLGMVKYEQGQTDAAQSLFAKALSVDPKSADANYNAGLIALAKNNVADAHTYFGKAAGTAGNLSAALGTSYIAQGDYAKAQNALAEVNSNNAALVQILNADYNGARKTIAAIAEPNAMTSYLGAIIGARTNDRETVYSNLKNAVKLDSSLIKKAASDLEFANYFTDTTFLSIVK